MNPIIQNILAILVGIILGSIVNMGIIQAGGTIIPPPEGVDPTDWESVKSAMHLYGPQHFIMPFLAHALGAFIGALTAGMIASNRKMLFALLIGVFFLLGGIVSLFLLPSPVWFSITDLVFAYIPFAWLGGKLSIRKSKKKM
jgi:hypothetical protein